MAFLLRVVTLDKDLVILGVQNLSFARPGASTLAPWGPFWRVGAHSVTIGAAESHL